MASFAEVFAPYGVSFGEYLVLAALRRAGPPYRMNPTRLFNSVILSSRAMTNRLDRLEEMGLIERLPDPTDRRGRLVELTDRGRELVDKAAVDHLARSGYSARSMQTSASSLRDCCASSCCRSRSGSWTRPLVGRSLDPLGDAERGVGR